MLGVVDAACQRAETVRPVQVSPPVMHVGAGIGAVCAVAKAVVRNYSGRGRHKAPMGMRVE